MICGLVISGLEISIRLIFGGKERNKPGADTRAEVGARRHLPVQEQKPIYRGWTAGHTKLQPAYLPSKFTCLEVILLTPDRIEKNLRFLNSRSRGAPMLNLFDEVQERDVKNALKKIRRR